MSLQKHHQTAKGDLLVPLAWQEAVLHEWRGALESVRRLPFWFPLLSPIKHPLHAVFGAKGVVSTTCDIEVHGTGEKDHLLMPEQGNKVPSNTTLLDGVCDHFLWPYSDIGGVFGRNSSTDVS